MADYAQLPWNFEAFRKFLNYQVLQNAAAVLCLFEDQEILSSPSALTDFEAMLTKRTRLSWSPDRAASEDLAFNIEGNLFRNKARVLTSMLLVDPLLLKQGLVVPTQFCRALAAGYVRRDDFYKEIISRYSYPHPAYDDNWEAWSAAGLQLRPLLFILEILTSLASTDTEQGHLSVSEFAEFGHSNPQQDQAKAVTEAILEHRRRGVAITRQRSDKVERKIGDIFGFMCMSQFCYYDKSVIRLNLLALHPTEQVHFRHKRGDVDVIEQIKAYISQSKERR